MCNYIGACPVLAQLVERLTVVVIISGIKWSPVRFQQTGK
jgi:hypothetical protein